MNDLLISAGLSEVQAQAYATLIQKGELTPPQLAKANGLTRSNAYKVLDALTELGVVTKKEKKKKFHYALNNPLSLNNIAAVQRNIATEQENALRKLLPDLLKTYRKSSTNASIQHFKGNNDVANAYRSQISLREEIFFIRTRADITAMGFGTMSYIRTAPSRYGVKRHVINPDIGVVPKTNESIESGSLTRTWVKEEDYNAPVEWSVTESSLLIVSFGNAPEAILIQDEIIAGAFMQLFKLLDNCLQTMPYYKDLPRIKD